MDRYPYDGKRIKPEAFVALLAGVVVAYAIQIGLQIPGGRIMSTLIVAAVGGLWYHWRRVL